MSIRIMVVDDSRIVHNELKKMLEGTEFELVKFCRSGEEALTVYETVQPDLVTMDIVMPGVDGLETAQRLLGRWPQARVVMVSSLAYDDTIDAAARLGAKSFVFKPFDREKLLSTLRGVAVQSSEEEG